MSSITTDDLFARALELSEDDRANLASLLIRSLEDDEPDPNRDAAWAAEIEARLQAVKEGRATLLSWEEVKAQLEQSLARSRKS